MDSMRRGTAAVGAVLVALMAGACTSGSQTPIDAPATTGGDASRTDAVPPEFRPACGHPGADVVVRNEPVTVPHAGCDLTGVTLSVKNCGGAVVPARGEGVGSSMGISVATDRKTGDVTVSASSCGSY